MVKSSGAVYEPGNRVCARAYYSEFEHTGQNCTEIYVIGIYESTRDRARISTISAPYYVRREGIIKRGAVSVRLSVCRVPRPNLTL